jgi:hypothetical protein
MFEVVLIDMRLESASSPMALSGERSSTGQRQLWVESSH